jgi:hypothetical protein
MDQVTAPAPRRRMGARGMVLRRQRIFARLREGLGYEEIAAEEGVSLKAHPPNRLRAHPPTSC